MTLPDFILESLSYLVKKLKLPYDTINTELVYDGMLTSVFRVEYIAYGPKIEETSGDDDEEHENGISFEPRLLKSFIVKCIKTEQRAEYDIVPAFMREFIFYQKIYPDLAHFQKTRGVKSVFHSGCFRIPKCYKVICNEADGQYALILQDMRRSHYFSLGKDEGATLAEATAVCQALGKFHAVSFAYRDQKPQDFAKYEKLIDPLYERMSDMEQLITCFLYPRIDEAIECLQPHEEFRKEKLLEFRETVYQTILSYVSLEDTEDCCVIGHGDSWSQNILFKKIVNGTQCCFMDFQLVRYGSCILDFVNFIFTSTTAELRNEHYHALTQTYHDSLCAEIRELGSDPEKLFPWTTFQHHLKRFGGYGLVMAMLQMEFIVSDEAREKRISLDEPPPVPQKRRSSIVPVGLVEKLKKTERQERLAGIVRDIVRLGYI
ncbi:uncharacterized protein LOC134827088 [Culicoides brevitarsis]|uniref:uncharacterized protein LOC134827088 n=1 Tax=Culicoides brevitarsis TaxID=469753 RepID=UPI00307B3D40